MIEKTTGYIKVKATSLPRIGRAVICNGKSPDKGGGVIHQRVSWLTLLAGLF